MVVGCWSPFVNHGGGGHWSPLVDVLVGTCCWCWCMHMGHGRPLWVLVVGGCGSMVAVVAGGGGGGSFMGGWHGCSLSIVFIWGQGCCLINSGGCLLACSQKQPDGDNVVHCCVVSTLPGLVCLVTWCWCTVVDILWRPLVVVGSGGHR